jgi:hypothetical protein
MSEQIGTSAKKVRGMAKASLDLIEKMHDIAEAMQPITGRGIGYKLFARGLIPSMSTKDMHRVYRLLTKARENGDIPWEWIVDETGHLEKAATWDNPDEFMRGLERSYRLDAWNQQPVRCEVISEKGTIRGVIATVLRKYAVGFRVMHGFTSATSAYDLSQDDDGRNLVLLYVGDFDPSGMFMSEEDLPERFDKYDGDHIDLRRIAITREQIGTSATLPIADQMPSFSVHEKRKDPRYKWFLRHHGDRCWELDAMDPRRLRDCVDAEITKLIDPEAWARYENDNQAEQESVRNYLKAWRDPDHDPNT